MGGNPTQSETLLPCPTPWCDGRGGEPYVFERRRDVLGVYCPTCSVSTDYHPTEAAAVEQWNTRLQSIPEPLSKLEAENAELRAERDALLQQPIDLAKLDSIDDDLGVPDKMVAYYWWQQAQEARAALKAEPLLDEGLVEREGSVEELVAEIRMRMATANIDGRPVLHVFDECAAAAIAALSIPRLEAGRVTVDEALRLADEAVDHAGVGSLTLDNASAQRLMDYGLLHHTDEGWVVSKNIWNASAPDGLPLVERMREASEYGSMVLGEMAAILRGHDLAGCAEIADAAKAKIDAALTELEERADDQK